MIHKRLYRSSGKKKVVVLCSRPPLSRRSRAVTVKKCTKSVMHVQIVVVLLILTYCFFAVLVAVAVNVA